VYINCYKNTLITTNSTEFTNSGIVTYSFEKYNNFNKNLKDRLVLIEREKKKDEIKGVQ